MSDRLLTPEVVKSAVPLLATLLLEVVQSEAQDAADGVRVEVWDNGHALGGPNAHCYCRRCEWSGSWISAPFGSSDPLPTQ